jgi:adenylate cyclase
MIDLRPLFQKFKHPLWIAFVLGQVVFLVLLGLKQAGTLESLDLMMYDFTLRSRPVQPADPRIVLIEETEDDLRRFGFPMPDGTLADILQHLENGGARVIGVDKYRDIPVEPGQMQLDSVLHQYKNIIWITKFGKNSSERVPPPRALWGSEQVGFNDLADDAGGVIRRGTLFLDDGKTSTSAFALLMALQYLAPQGITLQGDEQNPNVVKIGKTTLPPFEKDDGGYRAADAGGYQFLLDYGTMPSRLPKFTYSAVLDGRVPPAALQGKIILVGSAARSLNDHFYTPFSGGKGENQRIFGIELHAQILNQLLGMALDGKRNIHVLSEQNEILILWIACTLSALISFGLRSIALLGLVVATGVIALFAGTYFALIASWWIPIVPPLLGWVISASGITAYLSNQERNQRKLLMQIFATHVSNDVAEEMWREREHFLDGHRPRPQQLSATVMFTDIRGFTTISEELDPQALFDWLNGYMEIMSTIVIKHHGIINKYIGDAIMALFGVPLPRSSDAEIARDAVAAVDCALEMRTAIEKMNEDRVGQPPLGMRIGIFTGKLAAGTLGSSQRVEYTVIGDTVNVASRLESYKGMSDEEACRILIGESTLAYLDHRYRTQLVGSIQLKGKAHPITIYQVDGYAEGAYPTSLARLDTDTTVTDAHR